MGTPPSDLSLAQQVKHGFAHVESKPCQWCGQMQEIVVKEKGVSKREKGPNFGSSQKLSRFLKAYSETGSIGLSIAAANLTYQTIRTQKDNDPQFLHMFEEAQRLYMARVEKEMHRRGIEGIDEPVVSAGKLVTYKKKYSDAILLRLAEANDPKKYG